MDWKYYVFKFSMIFLACIICTVSIGFLKLFLDDQAAKKRFIWLPDIVWLGVYLICFVILFFWILLG